MASGPDRRTFLRGAAGAVGMGAVGAFSAKLPRATAGELRTQTNPKVNVKMRNVGTPSSPRWKIEIDDNATAKQGEVVQWIADATVEKIQLVRFKKPNPTSPARSPIKWPQPPLPGTPQEKLALAPGNPWTSGLGTPGDPLTAKVAGDAEKITYTYAIEVKAVTDAGGGVHYKDPDLDII